MELPSVDSARRFLAGEPGGLAAVVVSTAGRAIIIGTGAWVAGVRDARRLVAAAVGGAIAIELFVLWYTARDSAPGVEREE